MRTTSKASSFEWERKAAIYLAAFIGINYSTVVERWYESQEADDEKHEKANFCNAWQRQSHGCLPRLPSFGYPPVIFLGFIV